MGRNYTEMLEHAFGSMLEARRGKVLLATWVLCGSGVAFNGLLRYAAKMQAKQARKKAKALEGPDSNGKEIAPSAKKMKKISNKQLIRILAVAIPGPFSMEGLHLVAFTALLCARIWLSIRIAEVTGTLGKLVGARRWEDIFAFQVRFGLMTMPAAAVNSLLRFENGMLAMGMRRNLTKYIHDLYLNNNTFYRASCVGNHLLDNLDARCTQDVDRFVKEVVDLYGDFVKPLAEVVMYSRSLSRRMGARNMAVFFAYYVYITNWIQWIMPSFGRLTAEQQKLEGDFRSHHTRLLAHAEEIAFYNGARRERVLTDKAFDATRALGKKTLWLRAFVSVLDQYAVKYGGSMVAFSMLLPAVYLDQHGLKGADSVEVTGYYLFSTQLFRSLGDACKSLYMSGYKGFSTVSGLGSRVTELVDELRHRGGGGGEDLEAKRIKQVAFEHPLCGKVTPSTEDTLDFIEFSHVDVFSPVGTLLCKDLSLKIKPGEHLIIEGSNGCGKSSLLRVLCGLWPLCSGKLRKPALNSHNLFYVPQRPYFPPGSLRAQLLYPDEEPNATDPKLDKKLEHYMDMVGLPHLVEREGGWHVQRDWHDILSGGEKQRMAMARLFYHRPMFAVLDEATAAVSVDIEASLVSQCRAIGITMISISHRPQLRQFHSKRLFLHGNAGDGKWELEDIDSKINKKVMSMPEFQTPSSPR